MMRQRYTSVPNLLPYSRPMTELIVRRLLIDLEQPFERHWCDGDPFRTALFNAPSP